uniref:Endoplasmic reticulum transmembrane protein n=1 Tax=Nothobranchius furzeri TaxID=105023 RepID=A0A8C6P1N6_NOTFU
MTLQWTAVALFLYAEILINIFLWRLVFGWRIWSWLSPYWNKFFFAMIMALIVLFVDAVREVQKYSGPEPMQEATVNPNLYDHVHMKLFRAQRNLYICGFSLFLWLLLRLLTQLSLHHDRPVQRPHHCRCSTNPPIDLTLQFSLTREQDPEILKLLHLGQDLIPDPEKAFYPFPNQDHGLRFRGADSHPSCFTLGCEPLQRKLKITF